jgi:membrane protein DedA with SNARE-associated domain
VYEFASVTNSLITLVTHIVTDLGLPGIFLLLVAGSSGIPISSEAVMLFAGFDVYRGHFTLPDIIAVGVVGDLTGATIAYAIGYYGRMELVRRHGRKIHLTAERVDRAERWFARRGAAAVLISRMLPLIRAYTSFPAGAARMRYPKFILLSLAGGLPWIAAWGILGRELGSSYHSVQNQLHWVDIAALVVIVAAIVYLVVRRWRRAEPRPREAG